MTHYHRVPLRNGRPKRPMLPSWLLGVLLAGFALVSVLSAVLVFTTVRDFVAGWKITSQNPATPQAQTDSTSSPTQAGVVLPVATPQPGDTAVPTPAVGAWTGTDRVTILVMGIDRRQGEEEKGYLTDTMMLVTLDPSARTAAMLSIPRDLWVSIPGYEEDTINTANRTGDYYDYPGGGPALAVKTVEYNLGVTVNYYVRLDFTAFETFIDTIGGIDVYNETEIDDPSYPNGSYGYEPFYLAAGPHHLNGHDALRYARTRHGNSDIDRATRQQQVAMAVRERVLSLNMLPSLIAGAPNLLRTLNDSIWTNMSLEQMISLALLAQDIPRENIRSAVIDFKYVLDYTTPEGRQVLVPLRDKIRVLRDELFASTAAMAPATAEDEKSLMVQEEALVQVLNGAGVDGLGCLTQQYLIDQGVHADMCDTADRSDYSSSVIVDYTGNPYTVRFLSKIFGVSTIISGADPNSAVDVKVIVGQDWQVPVN
jgi:LCP family protein required for cell wall assembly